MLANFNWRKKRTRVFAFFLLYKVKKQHNSLRKNDARGEVLGSKIL